MMKFAICHTRFLESICFDERQYYASSRLSPASALFAGAIMPIWHLVKYFSGNVNMPKLLSNQRIYCRRRQYFHYIRRKLGREIPSLEYSAIISQCARKASFTRCHRHHEICRVVSKRPFENIEIFISARVDGDEGRWY